MKEKSWFLFLAVSDAPSVMTCNFKYDTRVIYPDRQIVLSFWLRKTVGHCCQPLMMVNLFWLLVIDHIIFLMRRVSFCYICIEVKYWLFDRVYGPPDYSYTKKFIEFLLLLQSNTALIAGYINYTRLHVFFIQSLFIYQLCHLLIIFVVVSLFVII